MILSKTVKRQDGTISYYLNSGPATIFCHIQNGEVTGSTFVKGCEPYFEMLDAINAANIKANDNH